jgi:hypothetical protein
MSATNTRSNAYFASLPDDNPGKQMKEAMAAHGRETLRNDHPAKHLEEMIRMCAPSLALQFYEWRKPKPPRPPLATRAVTGLAERLMRTGVALRSFVWAYSEEGFVSAAVLFESRKQTSRAAASDAWAPPATPEPAPSCAHVDETPDPTVVAPGIRA